MNEYEHLEQQVQLLVDNELNAEQTTALLHTCEQQPAAWKILALGMLEAREIKAGLSELLGSTDGGFVQQSHSQTLKATAMTSVLRGSNTRWWWHGAVACVALAMFVAGLSVPRKTQTPAVVENVPDVSLESNVETSAAVAFDDGTFDDGVAASGDTDDLDVVGAIADSEADQTTPGMSVVGYAQILHQVGSEPPIPVITGPGLDYTALLTVERQIPEAVARQYRNEGMVVENQRRVMSLTLADGQQFAIPLDQLGVRYVGNELL